MDFIENSEIISLIMRCRQGDDDAFSLLVVQYKPMLNNVISRAGLSVDEYFSDACMGLYNAALSYNAEQSEVTFGLYARICVSRKLLDILRREGAVDREVSFDVDMDTIAVPDGIVSRLLRREESEAFRSRAGELLSEYEYSVFLLWLDGCRSGDIAKRLSTDVKSVANAKNRILKKLRDGMR